MTDIDSNAKEIFFEALDRAAPDQLIAYVEEACGEDAKLRRRVDDLLRAHQDAGKFLGGSESAVATIDELITEKPGETIGPYKLLQQIGEGGMGVVFMAEQTQPLQRTVALKIIKPGMDTRQVIARFEAERQAVAMMDHPNIARVLDAGTTGGSRDEGLGTRAGSESSLALDSPPSTLDQPGRPYFVMELVKGVPITKYCDEKHLPLRARLELFVQVCQAVQHAHQKGIIHRDIKPNNVLVAEYDNRAVPKVIDFGVAKATGQKLTGRTMFTEFGQVLGTMEYMSPEQSKFNQLDIDTRSDIYSLGVMLYELLAGSTPFEGKRLHEAAFDEMLRIIREEEPPKPSTRLSSSDALPSIAANRGLEPLKLNRLVQGDLDRIVMKALEKDRNARYASANDLAADLEHWQRDEPISVRVPGLAALLRVWMRHNFGSTGWAVAIGVIWGLIGGPVVWLVMLNPLDLPIGVRRALYYAGVLLISALGPIIVWLVRPKNAAADLAAGTITGTLAAVITYTLSWGWVAVSIAGLPYGIWVGMATALVFKWSIAVIETLTAGKLLRRHGQVSSMIGPYAELILPANLAVVFACSALFRLATVGLGERFWHPIMVPLLVLAAISALARWPWYVRILLHAAWVVSLCIFLTM